MLEIRKEQLRNLAARSFVEKLYEFLLLKSSNEEYIKYLDDKDASIRLFIEFLPQFEGMDEQSAAAMLTYISVCRSKNSDFKLLDPTLVLTPSELEVAVKMQLESWRILRFSDFAS